MTLCCSPTFGRDPNQALTQLYHTSWNAKQGVSGSMIALAQTTDGYLWLGTSDGLLRFDGSSFEQYQPENGSLITRDVSALMAVPGGGLWVGYEAGGASFVSNGRVINYSSSDGFPVSTVRGFARDPSGAIWAAATGGFVRLEGQRWQKVRNDWNYPAKTAWRLLVDREGTLWVATGSQIVFLSQGAKQFQSTGIQTGKVFEIGEIPLELQTKLLRVLQEREFERLGSSCTLRTDARLIAATNRDLEVMVGEQKFRSDLFFV